MKQFLVALGIIVLVSGCNTALTPVQGGPAVRHLLYNSPPGPPKFKKGWKDGCHTGIHAVANHQHKYSFEFRQDYKLSSDSEYYTGWKIGWNFCQRYVYQYYFRQGF